MLVFSSSAEECVYRRTCRREKSLLGANKRRTQTRQATAQTTLKTYLCSAIIINNMTQTTGGAPEGIGMAWAVTHCRMA